MLEPPAAKKAKKAKSFNMNTYQLLSVLNHLLNIDRNNQYWNAANSHSKANAGKELLESVSQLEVFSCVLQKEGSESMKLNWDTFHSKIQQGIISILKPIHDKRNDLLSGLDNQLVIDNDQIDEILRDQLVDDFATILPLSDFLQTPSDMLNDTVSIKEQRKTYIEMLIRLSGNEFRDSTGSTILHC